MVSLQRTRAGAAWAQAAFSFGAPLGARGPAEPLAASPIGNRHFEWAKLSDFRWILIRNPCSKQTVSVQQLLKALYTWFNSISTYRLSSFEDQIEDAPSGLGVHLLALFFLPKDHDVGGGEGLVHVAGAFGHHVDFRDLVVGKGEFRVQDLVQVACKVAQLITRFA